MIVRRRSRIRIAVAVIVCLLFQQAAMAAYACTMTRMPAAAATMAEDCADMGMDMPRESAALCAKHCSPDRSVAADHAVLGVPALALPAAFALVLATPAAREAPTQDVSIERSDPPPRLRYCSLLI